jgi:hypothetical protein
VALWDGEEMVFLLCMGRKVSQCLGIMVVGCMAWGENR